MNDFAAILANPSGWFPVGKYVPIHKLLNLIAFGSAVDWDMTGWPEFRTSWGFDPDEAADGLILALREHSGQLTDDERELLTACESQPWLRAARRKVGQLSEEAARSAGIADVIKELADGCRSMRAQVNTAGAQIIGLIIAKKLTPYARNPEAVTLAPKAAYEFATPGLLIWPSGHVTVRNQTIYCDLCFEPMELIASLTGIESATRRLASDVRLGEAYAAVSVSSRDRLKIADAPLVDRMADMIASGDAKNPTDAARALAKEAGGAGNHGSKVTRLLSRWAERKKHRTQN